MVNLPQPQDHRMPSGQRFQMPWRGGYFWAEVLKMEVVFKKNSKTDANLMVQLRCTETVSEDKGQELGSDMSSWQKITGNYEENKAPKDRVGYSMTMKVIDAMVACGIPTADAFSTVSNAVVGGFSTPEEVAKTIANFNEKLKGATGKKAAISLYLRDTPEKNSARYREGFTFVSPDKLREAVNTKSAIHHWSDIEKRRIAGEVTQQASPFANGAPGAGGSASQAAQEQAVVNAEDWTFE